MQPFIGTSLSLRRRKIIFHFATFRLFRVSLLWALLDSPQSHLPTDLFLRQAFSVSSLATSSPPVAPSTYLQVLATFRFLMLPRFSPPPAPNALLSLILRSLFSSH